jgi:TP901 family phage tail tape measure protein
VALSARELLLIVRAQNQASGALRRVSGDMARLGAIRDLHFKQNQLGINQATLMRQRQRALNELQSIEGENGQRLLNLQRARTNAQATEIQTSQRLANAQGRLAAARKLGASPQAMAALNSELQTAQLRATAAAQSFQVLDAREAAAAKRASVLRSELDTTSQRLAQNAYQQQQVAKAINEQKWDKIQTGGRIMSHVGRVMQLGGLVAGGALAYMASGAAKFNSEATLVATQTGRIGSGFKTVAVNSKFVQNALLGLMGQTTATREELTQSAYDIYSSLSVSLKGGVRLLKMFSQASIAGMTPLTDVTAAGIHVMNAFAIPVRRMPEIMNRMFAAVRFGRMNFSQFTSTLTSTSPAMAAAGQSFDSLAGAMAFLTRMIPSTRSAGVALARLSEVLGRAKFVQGVKQFGVHITDAHGRLLPMIDVIDKLVKRFPRLRQGGTFLQNFFKAMSGQQGTIQARRAFTFMVLRLRDYHKIQGQVVNDNNEFTRSLAAMEQTTGVKWSKFVNTLRALALEIGTAVIPVLMEMAKPLVDLAHKFSNLDASTKDQIGRWAGYAAAILLVGGTFLAVAGMVISFVSALGKVGLAGSGSLAIIIAVIAALKVMKGEWRSISDVADSFASTMLGSFTGFVAMSGLAVTAALRLRKALIGVATAQAASTGMGAGAAGTGGFLAGLIGGARGLGNVRTFAAVRMAETEGGMLAKSLAAAGGAAEALPGPLKVAAAVIGLGAAASALWEIHMGNVRKEAEHAARYQAILQRTSAAPVTQARRFGGIGGSVRQILEQRNAIAELNAQIRQQRKAVQDANAANRPEQQRQLNALIYQRADAMDALDTVQRRSNQQFDAFNRALNFQRQIVLQSRGDRQRLANLQALDRATRQYRGQMTDLNTLGQNSVRVHKLMEATGITTWHQLKMAIQGAKDEVNTFTPALGRGAVALRNQFGRAIQSFQRSGLLTPRINPSAINAAFQVALRRGRMLTIPEIKTVIRASVSKADLAKAPRDIQNAIKQQRVLMKIQPVMSNLSHQVAALFGGKKATQQRIHVTSDADKVYGHMAAIFHRTIPGHVKIAVSPTYGEAVALGASIAQGIKVGAGSVNIDIYENVHKSITETTKKIGAHSPSTMTRDLIGIPLMQGIITGIELEYGNLAKAATLAINIFNGPWLTSDKFQNRTQASAKAISNLENRIHSLKKSAKGTTPEIINLERRLAALRKGSQKSATPADLIKDMRLTLKEFKQFNNAMSVLQKRGVPLLLLDQLSQLGAEGAKMIAKLAGMTKRQLRIYVNLWKRAMAEVAKSQRTPLDQISADLPQKTDDAAHFLLDKWNNFHDQLSGIFGGIGETYISMWNDAQDATAQKLDDIQQLVKTQFGDLFQGAYMQSQDFQTKMDWGHILNIDDLTKDLQSQVTAFNTWYSDISTLGSKVPADLLEYLRGLGPDAADEIHVLANSSNAALANYVKVWQQAQGRINNAVQNFGKFGAGVTPTNALQGQINKLNQFGDVITTLEGRHVPFSILQEIVSMGPDALPFAQALSAMSDVDLGNYVAMWNDYQAKLSKLTDQFMVDQVNEWRKHGSAIAAGIIAGVIDEQDDLLKFFRKLFINLLKESKKETKSHSPSKVFAGVGRDIVDGLAMGLATGEGMKVPTPKLGGAWMRGNGYSAGGGTLIHMEVNAHHDESLMTTLERASFRLRHRPT